MPLLLRRIAAAVSAPLRRSLCTAASRPPWALVFSRAALDASGAPSPGARASFDLDAAPYVSRISVPAHLADGMDFTAASVRATSSDGLLLLDLAETRHCRLAPSEIPDSIDSTMVREVAAAGAATELDVARFVCNPLSGQLFRLPVPDMAVAKTSSAFGLLTQSDGSHVPPDRYVVAQLCCRAGEKRLVVRRFLSETGEWDEAQTMPCSIPPRGPGWEPIQVHTSHDILAFGDRLWWVDVTWGAITVDPFSDRPELRFVALPPGSVLSSHIEMKEKAFLGKRRVMGVSEGKLRYVELSTEREPYVIRLFSLDEEGCRWKLTHQNTITLVNLPNNVKPQADHLPWIDAIDPFHANIVYFDFGHTVFAMDMATMKVVKSRSCPESITGPNMYGTAFFLPCLLPTWLESNHIPSPGTLSSKKISRERKTLADMLVRADKD